MWCSVGRLGVWIARCDAGRVLEALAASGGGIVAA